MSHTKLHGLEESASTIVRSSLALTSILLATALNGCAAEVMSVDEEGVVGSEALPVNSDFSTEGCSSSEKRKLAAAVKFINDEVTTHKTELTDCLKPAYFVEYKGNSAATLVSDLKGGSISNIRCVDAPCDDALACAGGGQIDMGHGTLADSSPKFLAGVMAHEIMHLQGYKHSVNSVNKLGAYYFYWLTVPSQMLACIASAGDDHSSTRRPNPWPGPGTGPKMADIVGAAANGFGYNCVYFKDGYASCGATDYLTKYTDTYYAYTLPAGYTTANVVAMAQADQYVCAYYDDGQANCGYQAEVFLPATTFNGEFFSYVLPKSPKTGNRYKPTDIAGMGGDDDNYNIIAWFKDGYASVGDWGDLNTTPYRYSLAPGYERSSIVEMLSDEDFNCVLYSDKKVSCGSSDNLDSKRTLYSTKF